MNSQNKVGGVLFLQKHRQPILIKILPGVSLFQVFLSTLKTLYLKLYVTSQLCLKNLLFLFFRRYITIFLLVEARELVCSNIERKVREV